MYCHTVQKIKIILNVTGYVCNTNNDLHIHILNEPPFSAKK